MPPYPLCLLSTRKGKWMHESSNLSGGANGECSSEAERAVVVREDEISKFSIHPNLSEKGFVVAQTNQKPRKTQARKSANC